MNPKSVEKIFWLNMLAALAIAGVGSVMKPWLAPVFAERFFAAAMGGFTVLFLHAMAKILSDRGD
jgi:hypothetical protein